MNTPASSPPPSTFLSTTINHALFWGGLLLLLCPLVGVGLFVSTVGRLVWYMLGLSGVRSIELNGDRDLAVVVTGCDNGFGRSYAFELARQGFVVFAGCLTADGRRSYDGFPRIVALPLDVTTDRDPPAAAAAVSRWLHDGTAHRPRHLHAVLSNAGVGSNGPIDWTPESDFQRVMEVNYFGVLRVVRAFLPLLKTTQPYNDARRLVVVGSFVGQVSLPGSPAYVASKRAVEALTTSLRRELRAFDVHVTSVNPTVHATTMLQAATRSIEDKWKNLSPQLKEEYGEDCYTVWHKVVADDTVTIAWDTKPAVARVVECVTARRPPPHVVLGADGKFVLIFLKILPLWLVSEIMALLSPIRAPLRMCNRV